MGRAYPQLADFCNCGDNLNGSCPSFVVCRALSPVEINMEIAVVVFFLAIFAGAGLLALLLLIYWLRRNRKR
jgi:hypothetical protein